jgi:hypothetical protein
VLVSLATSMTSMRIHVYHVLLIVKSALHPNSIRVRAAKPASSYILRVVLIPAQLAGGQIFRYSA